MKMREDQKSISRWAEETFGSASSNARVAARANEEMAELLRHLTSDDNHQEAVEEAADIIIVLYRLAERMGKDLHAEIDRKMKVNRGRTWRKAEGGCSYHVRPEKLTQNLA
jgi:NTP pyrophosphatase (non-canonical NTP hydrolase)